VKASRRGIGAPWRLEVSPRFRCEGVDEPLLPMNFTRRSSDRLLLNVIAPAILRAFSWWRAAYSFGSCDFEQVRASIQLDMLGEPDFRRLRTMLRTARRT
jgi:hypothetical protein